MLPEFQLTTEESVLVENASWLLTKHRIIGKVYGLFGVLSENYSEILPLYSAYIPEEVIAISPKIYKGEQYRQLPYVMMDHPRFFNREDTFAIRSFFWWGNSFSIHLLLGGRYKSQFQANISSHARNGTLDQWFLGVSTDPWQHHFEMDNYLPVTDFKSNHPLPDQGNYLKLARWLPLNEWKAAPRFFTSSYKELLEALS